MMLILTWAQYVYAGNDRYSYKISIVLGVK